MATIDSLKEILNENLDIEPEKVVESATFDELGIDSLDMAGTDLRYRRAP